MTKVFNFFKLQDTSELLDQNVLFVTDDKHVFAFKCFKDI